MVLRACCTCSVCVCFGGGGGECGSISFVSALSLTFSSHPPPLHHYSVSSPLLVFCPFRSFSGRQHKILHAFWSSVIIIIIFFFFQKITFS